MSRKRVVESTYTPAGSLRSSRGFGSKTVGPARRRQLRQFGWLLVLTPIALFAVAVVATLLVR